MMQAQTMEMLGTKTQLLELANTLRELRLRSSLSLAEMARKTNVEEETYSQYETGAKDFPFSFLHKCALALEIDLPSLLSRSLSSIQEKVKKRDELSSLAKFIKTKEDSLGRLEAISFQNEKEFNFAFDIIDELAEIAPNTLAMLHLDMDGTERRFTFHEMKTLSNQMANYFLSIGIGRGDVVMLVMKRHWQFWPAILALHKIGAIALPATHLLKAKDYVYRMHAANIHSIICTADGDVCQEVEEALGEYDALVNRLIVQGARDSWKCLDLEYKKASVDFERREDSPKGDDTMLMFFTSGTTAYPKIVKHKFTYPLSHYVTAKYWHHSKKAGMHYTIADTGWGKALWGKLYGQWLCQSAVFTYDFERFQAEEIIPLLSKYQVTSFCAPPTIYRLLIREDFDPKHFASVEEATTAGEAMNPEVLKIFEEKTGLKVRDGFGQTETTLLIGNLVGQDLRSGSLGKANPLYNVVLLDADGKEVAAGEDGQGEICVKTKEDCPLGLMASYQDEETTNEAWHDGYYHTGDMASRDKDGFFWYIGRIDDIINSSGYRIGPVEVESVIMELPYVLECAVTAVEDKVRGQVVKASIVLTDKELASEALAKEIQSYVKEHTAPYKYPRLIDFREDLPKSVGGKIQRRFL